MSETFTQTIGGRYNPMINNHCQYVFWRSTLQNIQLVWVSSFLVYKALSIQNGNFQEMCYFNFFIRKRLLSFYFVISIFHGLLATTKYYPELGVASRITFESKL